MKKLINTIISALAIAVILTTTTICAFAAQEVESNNNFASADNVSLYETVHGSLYSSDDYDYFRFTTPSKGYVTITLHHTIQQGTTHLRIYSYNGSSSQDFYHMELSSNYEYKKTVNLGLEAGTYYIKVSGTSEDYNFTIDFTSSSIYETENNDHIGAADSIYANVTYYGCSKSQENDYDWYSFTIDETQLVSVTLNHIYDQSSKTAKLVSYNGSSATTISSEILRRTAETVTTDPVRLTAGTYFVCIISDFHYSYDFSVNSTTPTSYETPTPPARPNYTPPAAPENVTPSYDGNAEYYEPTTEYDAAAYNEETTTVEDTTSEDSYERYNNRAEVDDVDFENDYQEFEMTPHAGKFSSTLLIAGIVIIITIAIIGVSVAVLFFTKKNGI